MTSTIKKENKSIKNIKMAIIIYIVADTVAVGIGMGIPILCILLGFPVGTYLAKNIYKLKTDMHSLYSQILKFSITSSIYTLFLMLIIWGAQIPNIFKSNFDFANFGEPLLLFEPKASFIGWLVLMILISPFLQFLVTIFSAFLTLRKISK